jgi:Predicted phosphotransferase related to Ser/Thr protein kinases
MAGPTPDRGAAGLSRQHRCADPSGQAATTCADTADAAGCRRDGGDHRHPLRPAPPTRPCCRRDPRDGGTCPTPDTLALRDYHAENLIWRPDLDGLARVGLLDFQDAFVAPLGYDLASLLRDARRDVPDDICAAMVAHFMAATGAGAEFPAQLACLGAQRNLRILGVFARLATEMGKTRYIPMIPRVWAQLQKDLAHPALSDLRDVVADLLPPPDAALLARLQR